MQEPLRFNALLAAPSALLIALAYPFIASPLQPASARGSFDCPLPAAEGETWITRRWIERGELRLECTHVAGFPVFDLPIARKVGLVP